MPLSYIKNEDIWDKAKDAFKKSYGKEPNNSDDWATVTSIYKKMGGKINSETMKQAEQYAQTLSYRERLQNMAEAIKVNDKVRVLAGKHRGLVGTVSNVGVDLIRVSLDDGFYQFDEDELEVIQ